MGIKSIRSFNSFENYFNLVAFIPIKAWVGNWHHLKYKNKGKLQEIPYTTPLAA